MAVHFYGMFENETYEFITGTVDLNVLKENCEVLVRTLEDILKVKQE